MHMNLLEPCRAVEEFQLGVNDDTNFLVSFLFFSFLPFKVIPSPKACIKNVCVGGRGDWGGWEVQGGPKTYIKAQLEEAASSLAEVSVYAVKISQMLTECPHAQWKRGHRSGGEISETRQMREARVGWQSGSRGCGPREEGGPCRPQLRPLLGDLVAKGSFRGQSHVLYFGIKAKSQGRGRAPLPAPGVSPGRTSSSGHLGVGAAAGNAGGTLRPGSCRLRSVLSPRPASPRPHATPLTWPLDSSGAEPHLVPEHSSSCEQSREDIGGPGCPHDPTEIRPQPVAPSPQGGRWPCSFLS